MPASYKIITSSDDIPQSVRDLSFKGGLPNIPDRFDVPHCQICDAPLTFFFQIAFPEKHVWEGRVMVAFDCKSLDHPCSGAGYNSISIPYTDKYIHVDDSLLDSYQKKFHFSVFNADEATRLQSKFDEKLAFERLTFEHVNPRARYDGMDKIGGKPAWFVYRSTDEGANRYKKMTYRGGGFDFLMQIENYWTFRRLPHVPLETKSRYLTKATAPERDYYMFITNHLKFFGTNSPEVDPPRVLMYSGQ